MPTPIDFYFDFMSPYSYLAATRVEAVAQSVGAQVRWKPVYLPGIMRATDNRGPTSVPAKAVYVLKDLNDWAAHLGLPPVVLPDPFPFQAARADRVAVLVAEQGGPVAPFAQALFRRIWVDGQDCNADDVLSAALSEAGLEAGPLLLAAGGEAAKALLRERTDELVAHGAFGLPTFLVRGEMFVGNDRLDFVARAAARG